MQFREVAHVVSDAPAAVGIAAAPLVPDADALHSYSLWFFVS